MPSILFVCTANQFRSPIAAACLLDLIQKGNLAGEWKVESAGTWTSAGLPAAATALQAAERLGFRGLQGHLSRQVSQKLLDEFDLILVMEGGHLEGISSEFPSVMGRITLLSQVADGVAFNVPDPFGPGGNAELVVSQLQALIQKGFQRILELAQAQHDRKHPMGAGKD
jgi:protein-tyrosine phosphatase